jgi:hypothetical protein
MSRISVYELTPAVLTGLSEPVEVCDAAGKVLGRYVPDVSVEDQELVEQARRVFDFAEADRRVATDKSRVSFDQVRQRLRDLEQSS